MKCGPIRIIAREYRYSATILKDEPCYLTACPEALPLPGTCNIILLPEKGISIFEQGKVVNIEVVEASDVSGALRAHMLPLLKNAPYTPAYKDGRPVNSIRRVEFVLGFVRDDPTLGSMPPTHPVSGRAGMSAEISSRISRSHDPVREGRRVNHSPACHAGLSAVERRCFR